MRKGLWGRRYADEPKNEVATRALLALEADGIRTERLVPYLEAVMEAWEQDLRLKALRSTPSRRLPAQAALVARHKASKQVRTAAKKIQNALRAVGCTEDDFLELNQHWLKGGGLFPVEGRDGKPGFPKQPRPSRLRVKELPHVLEAVAKRIHVEHPREQSYASFAEADLIDFVRGTSTSRHPHFRELADLLKTWMDGRLKAPADVPGEFDEDAIKMRDSRRRAGEPAPPPADSTRRFFLLGRSAAKRLLKSKK